MSYSRWGSSRWYTYWHTQSEDTENRDTALFAICACTTFTAKQLRADMDGCLRITEDKENYNCKDDYQVRDDDLDELRIYMGRFLENVNAEYPEEM